MSTLKLQQYQINYLPALVENANNPNVSRYLREHFPSPFTEADGRWWIEEGSRRKNSLNYAIVLKDQFVGAIGANFFTDERRHSAEIGFWLGETHWGKGVMTQALAEFSQQLLEEKSLHRLFSMVFAPNLASMRVLEKCGFEREGILRQAVTLRGHTYDEHVFAKLRKNQSE